VGIPIVVLHDAEGAVVEIETKKGGTCGGEVLIAVGISSLPELFTNILCFFLFLSIELIRGLLFEAEDMMNLYIKNAVVLSPNGVKRKTNQVYVRGPEIVFIVLPEMLKHAPMFKR